MSNFPFDPQARRRERIAAAQARQMGAAAAQRQAAGAAANEATVQEIKAMMAIADRLVVTPPGVLEAAVAACRQSEASVVRWRFEIEGHFADQNPTEIAKAKAALSAAIARARFDHERLATLSGRPLFTEPAEVVEPPATPPVETVTPPVEVPAAPPAAPPVEPQPSPAPSSLAT